MNTYYERPVNAAVSEPCEYNKAPTVAQIANELHQNLLEMKDVIDSINKCIFAVENDEAIPSTDHTIGFLYGDLCFDRELSRKLVEYLKIIREKLG